MLKVFAATLVLMFTLTPQTLSSQRISYRPFVPTAPVIKAPEPVKVDRAPAKAAKVLRLQKDERVLAAIDEAVAIYSKRFNVPPRLVLHFIRTESAGDPYAVSETGAIGLMQILPSTSDFIAKSLGEELPSHEALFEIDTNVYFGTWYVRHLLDFFEQDLHTAVSAYYHGPGAVLNMKKRGLIIPTGYASKVLSGLPLRGQTL